MSTSQKLKQIRPFVNIKIPANKKLFTIAEKRLISRYYNILDKQGYFNNDAEGYQLVSIKAKTAPKIFGAPKITKRFIEVGTVVENGKLKTNPNRKVQLRNGKFYVKDLKGNTRIWRFEYNIAKNWTQQTFVKHIIKQIGKSGLKKNQYFAIGAGLKYEVRGSISTSLKNLANDILKIGYGYTPNLTKEYTHNGQKKYLKEWLQEIVVYESIDDVESKIKNRKFKTRKKKAKVRNGKRDRNT